MGKLEEEELGEFLARGRTSFCCFQGWGAGLEGADSRVSGER
jgi:hypothetical protein